MYAVLCNPIFWRELEELVLSREEQILVQAIDDEIDIVEEFEKISRNPIKHIILDLTSIPDEKRLLYAIKKYKVKNDNAQIIIVAPNVQAPNALIHSLVSMGIYDIIAPECEELEEIRLSPLIQEVIEKPATYKKAVRWFIDGEVDDLDINGKTSKQGKVITKEKIVEVEKPVIIEKEVVVEREIVSDSIIAFIGNAPTGKSYISWNLAHAFSKSGYRVAYVNIDNCNSANSFFPINEEMLAFKDLKSKSLQEIVDCGYKVNNNLTVYTGEFGTRSDIPNDALFRLLGLMKDENDILIIDTASNYNENLNIVLQYCNIALFMFDLDHAHFNMNLILLDKIKDLISKKKTIALINNIYEKSSEIRNVKKAIEELDRFKDILTISNCGDTTYNYYYSNTCNYLKDDNSFTNDLDNLLKVLKVKNEGRHKKKRKLFSFLK